MYTVVKNPSSGVTRIPSSHGTRPMMIPFFFSLSVAARLYAYTVLFWRRATLHAWRPSSRRIHYLASKKKMDFPLTLMHDLWKEKKNKRCRRIILDCSRVIHTRTRYTCIYVTEYEPRRRVMRPTNLIIIIILYRVAW